jgi:phosphohistidine phosphatase
MDVYLVRHAIAETRDSSRWPDDAERPLTAAGEQRFRSAARGLSRIAPEVELVLSSPYVRAWRTAELLHEEAGWPPPKRCDALADSTTGAVVDVLLQQRAASVALVGHEPDLSLLASLLLAGTEDALQLDLKKGATVLLSLDAEPGPGAAVLRWAATPKLLRALDG